jgi:hypothetical protein
VPWARGRQERYGSGSGARALSKAKLAPWLDSRRQAQAVGVRLSTRAEPGSAGSANRRQNARDILDTRHGNAGIAQARPGIDA